jgi:hypothetical protein
VRITRALLDGPIAAAAADMVRRSWRVRVWLLLSVLVGIIALFVPLFDVLGYELALAASVFATLAAVDLGAAFARRLQSSPPPPLAVARPPLRLVAGVALRAAAIAVVIALVPGVIAAIHGIWATTCDWWFGIEAYLALPVLSAALFAGLGVAVGLVTGPHRVIGNIAPYLAVLAIAAWGVYRFYVAPPVFSYNPIIGYFPGNMYDEDIQLSMPLVWARLEALAWVVGLLALCAAQLDAPRFRVGWREVRPREMRTAPWIVAVIALLAALTMRLASGRLGHGIDADDISRELGGRIETAHFIIDYAKTPAIERELALIAADHEFRYAQVVARAGVSVPGKIHSYYFANTEQKARWMGARNVEMAKPWRREIYIDHRGFPHGSLRHEIAHVVAGEFGDPIFAVSSRRVAGVPIPVPGLIEGYAVAADWPGGYDRTITPHQTMRVLQVLDRLPPMTDLLSMKFLTFSSPNAYTTAGSFLKFLGDRYGQPALRVLYETGGDFGRAYGRSQAALVAEWNAFLATVSIPAEAVEANRERYGRGSVFDRPCPHATAVRRQRVGELAGEGRRREAIALMRQVCSDQPSEPRHRFDLSDMLAEGGAASDKAESLAILEDLTGPAGGSTSVQADALLRLADEAAARDDADGLWRAVLRGLTLSVDDSRRRAFLARQIALLYPGPAGPSLRAYFFATGIGQTSLQLAAAAVDADPAYGFAHYLYGLRAIGDDDDASGARELLIALDLGVPGTLFVRNAARNLALAAYRAGDTLGVERAIDTLATGEGMTEIDRLLALDWHERLVFDATGALPP